MELTIENVLGRTRPTPSGCREWRGPKTSKGYGRVRNPSWPAVGPRYLRVHRLVFEITQRPLRDGEVIRHRCDNPLCCSPEHLEVGTQAQNVRDMIRRDRHAKGAAKKNAKLTDASIAEARMRFMAGESPTSLAKCFDVSRRTMRNALHRKTWKHVA